MVPRTDFHVIIFVLSLLYFTCRSDMQVDFDSWISWNVKSYRKKTILETKWNVTGNGRALDLKLRQAESNKVRITVSQEGAGDFKTITEAINSIPPHNTKRIIVLIAPGVYREKVTIPGTLPFITLSGDARNPPTITGNDTASITGRDGNPLGTFQSATVAVDASYFMAVNIKFEREEGLLASRSIGISVPQWLFGTIIYGASAHEFRYSRESQFLQFWKINMNPNKVINNQQYRENTAPHVIGRKGEQGVALRISGTKAAFYNCSFYGDQDTLYDHKGLHYFNNCLIQGSVDFIFGSGRSLYENCHLISITKKVASITAQKRTNSSLESGFSFKNSVVTGSGQVYLGRAWGDYSRVVFSYTYMDKIVHPKGWSDWGDQNRDLMVYYGEYKCSGPGANMSARVSWTRILTDQEAQPFIGIPFIEGDTWLISP